MTIQLSDHFNYKKLLKFTLPTMAMMIVTSIYGVVDGFFISNFAGKTPFAAINIIWPFLMMMSTVGFIFGTGGSAIVAKTLGEGRRDKANEYFSLFVYVSFALGVIFAILGGLASFGIGNIAQSSEIAGAMTGLVGLNPLVTGILLAILIAFVLYGGVKRIGQVTSYLVPFMAMFYIAAGIIVIIMRIGDVPAVLANIVTSAFSFEAVGGGVFGYAIMIAMKQGFARGVFSNEAGLGSAPIAHAASSTEDPAEQAIWGVFEVFIDTIVICSITAFAVLLSGIELGPDALAAYSSKGAAAVYAFTSVLPGTLGGVIIQVSLVFFALSTILSWAYYGERCWGYLTNNSKVFDTAYKAVFILFCIVGATGSGTLMWDIADTLNGMMAIPNLIALLFLSGVVCNITKDYFKDKK